MATPPKKPGPGRPKSDLEERYQLRHESPEQRAAWEAAAATCGLTLAQWINRALDAEAARATHVPMIKREGRRG